MGVEGRDLVDLRLRHAELARQGGEARGRQVPVLVLQEVQALDQEVAAARAVAQQRLHFGQRARVDASALQSLRAPGPGLAFGLVHPFIIGSRRAGNS